MAADPSNDPENAPAVIVLVRDLMFSSRILAEARAAGVSVKTVRDPEGLEGLPGRRLIVDLNQPGCIDAAAAWKGAAGDGAAVLGFVSHVDAETIARARAVGIDSVMPRSQFVTRLAGLLREGIAG